MVGQKQATSELLLETVLSSLNDDKAEDVIVHVFRPEVREFYQLEKMWLPQPDAAS